jgi:hypothetical protein
MLVPRDLDINLIQQQNNKREDEQDTNKWYQQQFLKQ